MSRRVLAVAWLLAASVSAQHVWIVDKLNRAGTDFTSLQAAVNAAAPGDVLRLRVTTTNIADAYLAPTINNKAMSIVGESGPARAAVAGQWRIQGVPATQRLALSHLTLEGMPDYAASDFVYRPFFFNATSCPGAIVFDDIVEDPTYGTYPAGFSYLSGTWFINCALVVIQRCSLTGTGWAAANSAIVMTDTTFHETRFPLSYAALHLERCRLTLMGSWLDGGDANSIDPFNANPAIEFCGSEMRIGGGSRIEGGRDYYYGLVVAPATFPGSCGSPGAVNSSCSVDPSVIVLDSLWPSSQNVPIAYDFGPLTSITQTQTATTFTVTQRTTPQSVAVLAIGDLAPQPWTNIVGPAFLDPATASVYFDPSPATGPLVRTFTIPPGLPPGFAVMLQAFELQPGNRVVTSNVTFAGTW